MQDLRQKSKKAKLRSILTALVLGFLLSFPVTGFFYGFTACKDCGNDIAGRLFAGCVDAVLTTISFGAPWDNEAGTTTTNLRWYVFIVFLLLSILIYAKDAIAKRIKTGDTGV